MVVEGHTFLCHEEAHARKLSEVISSSGVIMVACRDANESDGRGGCWLGGGGDDCVAWIVW